MKGVKEVKRLETLRRNKFGRNATKL